MTASTLPRSFHRVAAALLLAAFCLVRVTPSANAAEAAAAPAARADQSGEAPPSTSGPGGSPAVPEPKPAKSPAKGEPQPGPGVEEITVGGSSVTDAVDQARFSESVVDVLSAKDFAVTGDSGVVGALSRVTGITTVGDKYVYVRGLGERYSSTLFNGALLPSPDPVRRVVPLDLFPSTVMQQLSVQKTWAPYLPADFAGGSVQLGTREVPSKREARLSFSTAYNTNSTGNTQDWYQGSGSDWTGYDGGYRDLPKAIDLLASGLAEDRKAAGLALNRSFDLERKAADPDFKLKGSWGDQWSTRAGDVGLILGGQADNSWRHVREKKAVSASDPYDPIFKDIDEDRTTNSILYSGLAAAEWKPREAQVLKATLFYTHNTDKRLINEKVVGGDNDESLRYLRSEWEEQSLVTSQLKGTHTISSLHDLGLDWGLTYSQATRNAPDSRFYMYEIFPDTGKEVFSNDVSNERTWETLTDNAWDAFLQAQEPLKISDDISTTLTVGGRYFLKQRDSELRRFRYNTLLPASAYEDLPIDQIFADPNIGPPGGWQLREVSTPTDLYSAQEELLAGFLQAETEIGSYLRWMVGGRYEAASQQVDTPKLGEANRLSTLDNAGIRPGTELTVMFRDDLQLRAAFSQTVNRPDLRELAPQIYLNPTNRYLYYGNPDLEVAELLNYDLRLEWYHDGSDNVQLAGFYKDLTNPIEEVLRPAGGLRTFENADQGWLYGVELAVQQNLAPLGRWADEFTLRSNGAWIQSEATSPPGSANTNKKHALQGQSEWVANAQVTWEKLPWDLDTTLAFNMQGPRIADLGTNGIQDAYEQPAPTLDFTLRKGFEVFGTELNMVFKARNLVDPLIEVTRQSVDGSLDVVERSYRLGRTFTLEFGKDF